MCTGVGVGAGAGVVWPGLGELLGDVLDDGLVDGDGDVGGELEDVAGHVCDKLKNVAGWLAPVAVSMVAEAAVSCAPGAENTIA